MPDGIRPEGDDQQWKDAMERKVAVLERLVATLTSQVQNLNRR